MTDRVKDKICLVSAAGQGIGRASALALAKEGAVVHASDIDAAAVESLANEHGNIVPRVLDVTDAQQVQQAASELGRLDGLFNCAGFVHHGSILDCPEDEWDFAFELNVKSMYRMIRAFLPAMLAGGGGSIVNMSSIASSLKGAPQRFAYGTTKAAVLGLTKAVAADYVKDGIRCNAICPGTVQSPSLDQRISAQGDLETARAAFIARQPIGRIGTAEEIAAIVVHLLSDESAYTTGSFSVADGGWSI